jgi:hypothetical protein
MARASAKKLPSAARRKILEKAAPKREPEAVCVQKVSVSLDADDLAWARQEAKERSMSLSAVLSESLHRRRKAQALGNLLTRLGADKISSAELSSLRAELYGVE